MTGNNPAALEEASIVFTPSGKRGVFPLGTPILQAARQLGVDIDSVCGGRGICGRCQVKLSAGHFAKHGIHSDESSLNPVTRQELRYQKRKPMTDGTRLSCHALLQRDVVIDVPASSQVHRQVVRKAAEVFNIELDPVIERYYLEVEEPSMDDPSGDADRLLNALEAQYGIADLTLSPYLLGQLQTTLRAKNWKVTCAVREHQEIVGIWAGFRDKVYGIAIDLGSTTLAAHLCNLNTGEVLATAGSMNPQIRFGEDLMSRVSYSMMNANGAAEMTAAVRTSLAELCKELINTAAVEHDTVLEVTLVGNPIMHHLLLGIDPVELGGAPFALAIDAAATLPAMALDLGLTNTARVYILPCIAGHVGADTAGVLLAEAPEQRSEMSLLVDVGTNAEIILGNETRLYAASSPTGPAFEGAQISSGQRAAPGAIERFRIDRTTLKPRFKVIGSDLWSDQADFDHSLQTAGINGVTGICGSGIIEAIAELYLAGIIDTDGVFDATLTAQCDNLQADGRTWKYLVLDGERPLYITQNDIRAIQLAKAALYAGIKLLMDHAGIQQVDRIRLAGAFGAHIDVKYAMALGLIPDCDLNEVSAAGNAAGSGARIALLSKSSRQHISELVRKTEKIETALAADFQEHFVNAMAIPHKTERFAQLRQSVTFPPAKNITRPHRNRRRRRKS